MSTQLRSARQASVRSRDVPFPCEQVDQPGRQDQSLERAAWGRSNAAADGGCCCGGCRCGRVRRLGLRDGHDDRRPGPFPIRGGESCTAACDQTAGARRLPEAATRLHCQRWPDRRARPLLHAGRRLLGLPHAQRGDARPPAPGQAAEGEGCRARSPLPRLEPKRRHPRRAPRAGPGQLPTGKRPLQVADRPAHLRSRRLPQPLARRGHVFRRTGRQAEVRVPRPPKSTRPGH